MEEEKCDALRCHNRMPHSYFLIFLSKRSLSNLQKWRNLFIVCVPNEKLAVLHYTFRKFAGNFPTEKTTTKRHIVESTKNQCNDIRPNPPLRFLCLRPTFQESIRCYLKAMVSCWTDGQQQLIWWIAARNTGGFWAIITCFWLIFKIYLQKMTLGEGNMKWIERSNTWMVVPWQFLFIPFQLKKVSSSFMFDIKVPLCISAFYTIAMEYSAAFYNKDTVYKVMSPGRSDNFPLPCWICIGF